MTTALETKFDIILAPTAESAMRIAEECAAGEESLFTVEAEYGDTVVQGTIMTLAHHTGEWRRFAAPCNRDDVKQYISENPVTVLVSHIDLDTVGGVFRIMLGSDHALFNSPAAVEFWAAAEFVDLNGPHKLAKVESVRAQKMLQAVWAWSSQNRAERVTEPKSVLADVMAWLPILEKVIAEDAETLAAGQDWAAQVEAAVEGCYRPDLSSADIRVFITDSVFCNAAYRNPQTGVFARACVVLNTKFGSVTVSALDNAFNCKDVVQGLWGELAGGHPGIAGSPRGQTMTEADLAAAVAAVKAQLA